jgi:hypoxanthine phosphoribosyltransferase
MISEQAIEERVSELAAQISADYSDKGDVVLVGVLKGAFIFLADLSRRLTIPRTIEFIAVSSYETGSVSSSAVRLVMDVQHRRPARPDRRGYRRYGAYAEIPDRRSPLASSRLH